MEQYQPDENLNFDSEHTIKLRFLWGQATAEIIATMSGNICGGDIIGSYTNLESGFSAKEDIEVNRKHCMFDPNDMNEFREVISIYVYHPVKGRFTLSLDEAQRYLVSVEIIDFKEDVDDDEESK